MLIVCNGAAKSGSTWLYNIVDKLTQCEWPDRRYLTTSTKHPTIRPDALEEFLLREDITHRNYITKTHYGNLKQRALLLRSRDVKILGMNRDLRDTVVSSYYDSCRRDGFRGTFESFYWLEGRTLADYLIRYHQLWTEPHERIFITSFERLKKDFKLEARRISDFLGTTVDQKFLASLELETSIDGLRESYKDDPFYADPNRPFFRKGEIGDWKNHFTQRMTADIERLEERGLSDTDPVELLNRGRRLLYRFFPLLSPYAPGASRK